MFDIESKLVAPATIKCKGRPVSLPEAAFTNPSQLSGAKSPQASSSFLFACLCMFGGAAMSSNSREAVITQAPSSIHVEKVLAARQSSPICGWEDGNPNYPGYCVEGFCAVNTFYNAHACCFSVPCAIATSCVGWNPEASQTVCDSDCLNNPYIIKCNAAPWTACLTKTWIVSPHNFYGVQCFSEDLLETFYTSNVDDQTASPWSTFGVNYNNVNTQTLGLASFPGSSTSTSTTSTTSTTTHGKGSDGTTNSSSSSSGGSSIDMPALIASLGTIAGVAVLLGLGYCILKWRKTSQSPAYHSPYSRYAPSRDDVNLGHLPNRADFPKHSNVWSGHFQQPAGVENYGASAGMSSDHSSQVSSDFRHSVLSR